MAEQMNQSELFRHWLVGQLDPDKAAWNEVLSVEDGEQLGEFCVADCQGGSNAGQTVMDVTFEDGSKIRVWMERI